MQLLTVALHTAVIVALLLAALRTFGRRSLLQLTIVQTVAVLLLGSAVETAMVAGDTSLAAGLVSAAVLLLLNRAISVAFARLPRLRHRVAGVPVLLVHDGRVQPRQLRRAGLTEADLEEALRERGEDDVTSLRAVVLEPNGAIHAITA